MTSTADAAALTSEPADLELHDAEPNPAQLEAAELNDSGRRAADVAVSATPSAEGTGAAAAEPAEAQVITLDPPVAALPSAADSWFTRALQSPLIRAVRAQTLTAPAGLILATALLVPGVFVDLLTDATAGRPTAISFLLAAGIPPLVVRRKALGTAAVAPPVLFATALLMLAWGSGQNATNRQVVLDAGTSLALTAPHLFAGTVVAVVLVLARLSWGLVHRG